MKDRGSSRWKYPNIAVLLLAVIITLACPKWLYGWSSVKPTTVIGGRLEAFATHEFLNAMAYEELKKHPAVKRGIVKFPSLDEIQDHSMVDRAKTVTVLIIPGCQTIPGTGSTPNGACRKARHR